jgi:hypothetical protein
MYKLFSNLKISFSYLSFLQASPIMARLIYICRERERERERESILDLKKARIRLLFTYSDSCFHTGIISLVITRN